MSATVNTIPNKTANGASGRRAVLRLAIPVWTFGRRQRAQNAKRGLHTSRDEIVSLFREELRRPIDPALTLTPQERKEYNEALRLRSALYEAS